MEANRDAAQQALATARTQREAGNDAAARRLVEKALRLDPTLETEASDLSEWLAR